MSLPYVRCPTCGTVIGPKTDKFLEDVEELRSNPKLSDEEKSKKRTEILVKFDFDRYCCRLRIMGAIATINVIK